MAGAADRESFFGFCDGQHDASLDARRQRDVAQDAGGACAPGRSIAGAIRGRTPERVLIAPPDLRLADSQIALEIYYGRFPLSGHLVETGGESPFQINVTNRGWQKTLHGFRWLRHMRAAGTDLAAANARALVSDWIATHGGSISGVAWEPATTSKRVIAWLQHSSVVLQGAEFPFYRAFLKSPGRADPLPAVRGQGNAGRQGPPARPHRACLFGAVAARSGIRPTQRHAPPGAGTRPPDPARRRPHLAQPADRHGTPGRPPAAALHLRQPGRDASPGAHQCRRPDAAGATLLPPHDGSLARFNGMGATIHDRIAAILRHDDTEGAPLLHAPHSGYERLSMGGTTVIADTGAAPPIDVSNAAHAGCLSFEMSSRPSALRRQLRRRHLWRGGIPAACPRHGSAFHRHPQRHLVRTLQPFAQGQRPRQPAADRRAAQRALPAHGSAGRAGLHRQP